MSNRAPTQWRWHGPGPPPPVHRSPGPVIHRSPLDGSFQVGRLVQSAVNTGSTLQSAAARARGRGQVSRYHPSTSFARLCWWCGWPSQADAHEFPPLCRTQRYRKTDRRTDGCRELLVVVISGFNECQTPHTDQGRRDSLRYARPHPRACADRHHRDTDMTNVLRHRDSGKRRGPKPDCTSTIACCERQIRQPSRCSAISARCAGEARHHARRGVPPRGTCGRTTLFRHALPPCCHVPRPGASERGPEVVPTAPSAR